MASNVRIDKNVPVEMRDGTLLRADVYRPADDGTFPCILIRTPYDKSWGHRMDFFDPVQAASEGFAVVIQDIRGRYASDGVWDRNRMFEVEGPDGYDSVEWVAAQPWSDKTVGMAGASYLTALQWLAAFEHPPHLKAFAPCMGDIHTMMQPPPWSGAIHLYSAADAMPKTALDFIDRMIHEGVEGAREVRPFLERAIEDPALVYEHLPLAEVPFVRFEPLRRLWLARLRPATMAEQARYRRYEQVRIPGLHIGGWFDGMEWATLDNFVQLCQRAGTEAARRNQHLLVGPWMHARATQHLGAMEFGASAGGHALLHQYSISFFRKYLCGQNVHLPRVRYFVMGLNTWREAEEWPLPQTRWLRHYLHSMGHANTAGGDGRLTDEPPGDEPQDQFVYDPLDPVPSVGGRVLPVCGLVPGPMDQSFVERRPDVLCYTSPELVEDVEVTGPVRLVLYAATSAEDTDFCAKLVDVWPDGRAFNVAEGIQRARFRNRGGPPQLVTPGEVCCYDVFLGNTSYQFRRGHRIRLDLTSSHFPMYDRNMNTGNPVGEDATGIRAVQQVFHCQPFASFLELPVIPA